METSSESTGSGPRMRSVIYHALSQKEAKELDIQRPGAERAEAFLQAFLRRCTPHMSQSAREDQLQRKAVVLEYFTRRRGREPRRRARGLSARQRRALRLFDIKPEQQRYDLFLPLHELWKQYIRDLCNGLRPDTQPQAIQAKLLKADLHGAVVSGEGLRARGTRAAHGDVSDLAVPGDPASRFPGSSFLEPRGQGCSRRACAGPPRGLSSAVIPKLGCVFSVETDGFVSYIHGSKFQLRSSERSAKKFKAKGTMDL
ncbi:PREDICTED: ribonuclease P protein subunit p29 [Myotis davidii]|uniref:ribonuclease P protein subunit p29 n=1 Tax=Myotis davidii TaxID=225400 RepID=UPI000767B9D6|nr:PREDICTED: ribonuclease P protein subunit p29 [Myotis davidii]